MCVCGNKGKIECREGKHHSGTAHFTHIVYSFYADWKSNVHPPSPPLCCQSSASFRPTLPLLTHCVSLPCVSCRRAILILVLLLCWIEQSPLSPCLYSKALQVSCTSALFITHNQLLSAYLT